MKPAIDALKQAGRLPAWFRGRGSRGGRYREVSRQLTESRLHTVCESARCPNRSECWSSGTATVLILGNRCTRSCRFCSVPKGSPAGIDPAEPGRVAEAAVAWKLSYIVITSVTRDDLPDGGAGGFAATIDAMRQVSPDCRVEVLIPDLQGSRKALGTVLDARPAVLGHNLETVASRYPAVRPQASYRRSLSLLENAKARGMVTKSGIMIGLGETGTELKQLFRDLASAGCDILTIGQYLRPGREHLPVQHYYHPDDFQQLAREARSRGIGNVSAGPLVRSSYGAQEQFRSFVGSSPGPGKEQ